ncbi:MAG: hypothetical protein ACOYM9_07205 [Bradymonadia bacterium]|jgi:hypothetical protein
MKRALCCVLWAAFGCGGGVVTRVEEAPTVPAGAACVVLEGEPADAAVEVDGRPQGVVSGWRAQTLCVAPGRRRLRLSFPGHYPEFFDLELAAGATLTLRFSLLAEPSVPGEHHVPHGKRR